MIRESKQSFTEHYWTLDKKRKNLNKVYQVANLKLNQAMSLIVLYATIMKAIHLLLNLAINVRRKRLLCQALNGLKTTTMRNSLTWICAIGRIKKVGKIKGYHRGKLRRDWLTKEIRTVRLAGWRLAKTKGLSIQPKKKSSGLNIMIPPYPKSVHIMCYSLRVNDR